MAWAQSYAVVFAAPIVSERFLLKSGVSRMSSKQPDGPTAVDALHALAAISRVVGPTFGVGLRAEFQTLNAFLAAAAFPVSAASSRPATGDQRAAHQKKGNGGK